MDHLEKTIVATAKFNLCPPAKRQTACIRPAWVLLARHHGLRHSRSRFLNAELGDAGGIAKRRNSPYGGQVEECARASGHLEERIFLVERRIKPICGLRASPSHAAPGLRRARGRMELPNCFLCAPGLWAVRRRRKRGAVTPIRTSIWIELWLCPPAISAQVPRSFAPPIELCSRKVVAVQEKT